MVGHVGDDLPYVTASPTTWITPTERFSCVKLKNPQTDTMDRVPVAKSGVVTRLKEMIGSGMTGEHPHGPTLVGESFQSLEIVVLKLLSQLPYYKLCGSWSDRHGVWLSEYIYD
ncbi:hypothetical protein TNCV_4621081 [Trichonephila clavipes]|nr:hypothetical protein TNCV_4621081 [Trichonephila clavipes]